MRRVLICDERPRAVQALTELVTAIPSVVDIDGVRDGFGAVAAFAHPARVFRPSSTPVSMLTGRG